MEKEVLVEQVLKGDKIRVKPGEKVPVDGKIVEGKSYIDESMISGEPIPVGKKNGDEVFAGTINQKGSFIIETTGVGEDTILGKIIEQIRKAQSSKAPIQKLADKVASYFVPIVIVIAIMSFAMWNLLGGENAFAQALAQVKRSVRRSSKTE